MTRNSFQKKNEKRWSELEQVLDRMDSRKETASAEEVARLPGMFRQICNDLSLAQHRLYGVRLCDRLNLLVIRGYNHLYQDLSNSATGILHFAAVGFPRMVRQEWRLFWLVSLLFWGPFLTLMMSGGHDPRWIHAILGPEGMASMEAMYGKGQDMSDLRAHFGSHFQMFTFYILNNVGIGFRMFAGGILAGLGTIFFVLYNGVYLGAAFGYVHEACDVQNFYLFVIGHSSWELIGLIIAGVAGLRLGLGIINPGRLPRKQALVESAKRAVKIVAGAGGMIFIAAIIEGFWSGHDLAPVLKYTFGGSMWVLVIAYLLLAGRTWREA